MNGWRLSASASSARRWPMSCGARKSPAHITGYAKSEATRKARGAYSVLWTAIHTTAASGGQGCRSGYSACAGGRLRGQLRGNRCGAEAGLHCHGCGFGQGCGGARCGPHLPAGAHFIHGHPIAGTGPSGLLPGFADLFLKRWCSSRRCLTAMLPPLRGWKNSGTPAAPTWTR